MSNELKLSDKIKNDLDKLRLEYVIKYRKAIIDYSLEKKINIQEIDDSYKEDKLENNSPKQPIDEMIKENKELKTKWSKIQYSGFGSDGEECFNANEIAEIFDAYIKNHENVIIEFQKIVKEKELDNKIDFENLETFMKENKELKQQIEQLKSEKKIIIDEDIVEWLKRHLDKKYNFAISDKEKLYAERLLKIINPEENKK